MDEWGGAFRPRAGRDKKARVAKSDLNSTDAYFATKNQHQKMAQKWPKTAQKLAPAENSTDKSAASATFCISAPGGGGIRMSVMRSNRAGIPRSQFWINCNQSIFASIRL